MHAYVISALAFIVVILLGFCKSFFNKNQSLRKENATNSMDNLTKIVSEIKDKLDDLVTKSMLALFKKGVEKDIRIHVITLQGEVNKAKMEYERSREKCEEQCQEARGMKQQTRAVLGKIIDAVSNGNLKENKTEILIEAENIRHEK